jgi:hypothetical protein
MPATKFARLLAAAGLFAVGANAGLVTCNADKYAFP